MIFFLNQNKKNELKYESKNYNEISLSSKSDKIKSKNKFLFIKKIKFNLKNNFYK